MAHAAACEPQTQLDVGTIKPQMILVGETHGTEQAPAFVAGLVCSLLSAGRPVILALERQDSEQAAMDRYLESDGSAAERQALLGQGAWNWSIQDGRNSQSMLALVERVRVLRRAGQPVGILATQHFANPRLPKTSPQPPSPANALSSRMNDRFMADMIASALGGHSDYTVVALAGSYHTSTQAGSWAAPQHQPMGQVLAGLMPIFVIGLNSVDGGTAWNCTRLDDCGTHRVGAMAMYAPGNQLDAIVELGKLSASEPAVPASR